MSEQQKPAATGGSKMDKLVALCRRRGFIFQSSEIYGGINGFWDYGPLGVELFAGLVTQALRRIWSPSCSGSLLHSPRVASSLSFRG